MKQMYLNVFMQHFEKYHEFTTEKYELYISEDHS